MNKIVNPKCHRWVFFLVFTLITVPNCSKKDMGVIRAPGMVDGDIITSKSAIAGTIQQMDIVEGQKITRGQLIAEVDPDKIRNQLEELDIRTQQITIDSEKLTQEIRVQAADVQLLEKQVERFRRLKSQNAVSGESLETLELKLQRAQTALFNLKRSIEALTVQREQIRNKRDYLKLTLNDYFIKSPVDGVILEKFVSPGEQVFPGTAIADILDVSSLYVEIFIEENEMGRLKLNDRARIQPDGSPRALTGTLSYFGRKAEFSPKYIISEKERKSLLYQVKIKIQDPEGILKIGMPVTVTIRK
ncbi:MAG: HlyD family secretion protein [Candidatus Omnitrophota bacterium]